MNAKQQRFVAEYLIDLNGTQAAIRAGYSPKSAEVNSSRLLRNAKVAAAVAEGKAKQLSKADLSAVRVLEEIRRVGMSDIRKLFDSTSNLKQITELSDEEAATIASVEVVRENVKSGDGHVDTVHKVKLWDKIRSLEMLAKHFGLLIDKLEHSGEVTYKWQD